MFKRTISFFIVGLVVFSSVPFAQGQFSLFGSEAIRKENDSSKEKEIFRMLKHYLTWRIPKSYEMEASAWDDGSGINIDVKPKESKGSQEISLSIIKQESDAFYTLPEIVLSNISGGGRDLGMITIRGFQWARYISGYVGGENPGSHRCAATIHKDLVIWMCMGPEDPDHKSSNISTSTFNKILKSIKIKQDAYFIPTNAYIASRQFNNIYNQLYNCLNLDDRAETVCIQRSAEKALRICQKFKQNCDYLAEQVKYVRLLDTDDEEIPENEVFGNIAHSIVNLRSGGGSLPESESDGLP